MNARKTQVAAPRSGAAKAKALQSATAKLHDAAQAVLTEIDRLALVCAGSEDLRQALRDYRAALP
jgi:hypothetical protein